MKLDALLLVLLALIPSLQANFNSDEAHKYLSPATIFFWSMGLATFSAGAGALKGFRSTQFSDSKSKPENNGSTTAAAIVGMFALLMLPAFLSGCAMVNQSATSTQTGTNGVLIVTEAHSRILAIGDAKTTVERVRASAGKTSNVGLTGVDNEGSGTNAAAVAGEFLGTLIKTAK